MKGQLATTLLLALVLTILGVGLIMLLHVGTIEQQVKSMMDVVVELKEDVSQDNRQVVMTTLQDDDRVVANSVDYIPRDQAVALMGGDEVDVSLLRDNPFSDLITFNLHADAYTEDDLASISSSLQSLDAVATVSAQSAAAADISALLRKVAWAILLLGLIVSILAATLLHTSASMRLAKDRKRIRTMQLVGARQDYIERPYLRSAISQAVLATVIATMLLTFLAVILNITLSPLVLWYKVVVVAVILLLLSVIHGVVTSKLIIDRYLRF